MKQAALAIALGCAAAARLAAQPAPAHAEAMFRQGKELLAAGKIAEACAAFEASQKAEAAVTTLLNLASCREKNGEIATAWGLFVDAERQTRAGEDAASKKLHTAAVAHAASLEKHVPHLTITVAGDRRADGLEVVRDGTVVEAVAWNRALPIDGGKHVIEARAPGRTPWRATVEIAAHDDSQNIEVPVLAAIAPVEPVKAEAPAPAPVPTRRRAHERRIAPWILSGTAVAAAGAAVGLELWARSTYDSALAEPDPVQQGSLWHSANTKRYAADGLAVGSVGCVVVAVWLFARGGDGGGNASASVQPLVGGGNAGLVWAGSW